MTHRVELFPIIESSLLDSLHAAITQGQVNEIRRLTDRLPAWRIEQILLQSDEDRNTPLHHASESLDIFFLFLEKLDGDGLVKVFSVQNLDLDTPLHKGSLAHVMEDPRIIPILSRLSPEQLEQILLLPNRSRDTAFHLGMEAPSSEIPHFLISALERFSLAKIDEALSFQNVHRRTLFHIAIARQAREIVQTLVWQLYRLGKEVPIHADDEENTPLHLAVMRNDPNQVALLIEILSHEQLLRLLSHRNELNETPFEVASNRIAIDNNYIFPTPKIFALLIQTLSDRELQELGVLAPQRIQSIIRNGGLEYLRILKTREAFNPLMRDEHGATMFHWAIQHNKPEIFKWLVSLFTNSYLQTILTEKMETGMSLIEMVSPWNHPDIHSSIVTIIAAEVLPVDGVPEIIAQFARETRKQSP